MHSTRNTSGISCVRSYRTLRDGSFGVALSQALKCLATFALSLRDISQQPLVRLRQKSAAKAIRVEEQAQKYRGVLQCLNQSLCSSLVLPVSTVVPPLRHY
jgi:hypothetical protein